MVMECLGVCGEIRTLQVSLREVVSLPSGLVGEDSKKVFAWYMVSKPIFTSARRHFFRGAYAKINPVFASRRFFNFKYTFFTVNVIYVFS